MDRNVNISISERIHTIMDAIDELSMDVVDNDKVKIAYELNSAYSDIRLAYLKAKKAKL